MRVGSVDHTGQQLAATQDGSELELRSATIVTWHEVDRLPGAMHTRSTRASLA